MNGAHYLYALDPSNDELSKADFTEASTKDYYCDLFTADAPVKYCRILDQLGVNIFLQWNP